MGLCMSSAGQIGNAAPYVPSNDGGEQEFKAHYVEGDVLGQGEFGAVLLCHATSNANEELAVKDLSFSIRYLCEILLIDEDSVFR